MTDIETPDLYDLPDLDEREPGWIDGLGRAAYCMDKHRKLTRARREIASAYAEHIAEWTAWAERQYARIDPDLDWHAQELGRYALARRAAGHGKTVELPGGKITTKSVPARWEVDAETAIKSAKEQGLSHLVKTEEKFELGQAKRLLTVTDDGTVIADGGVIIDGITVGPARMSATIVPDPVDGGTR